MLLRTMVALPALWCLLVATVSVEHEGMVIGLDEQLSQQFPERMVLLGEGSVFPGQGPCKMSSWSGHGACSMRCGGGRRTWRRVVISKPSPAAVCGPTLYTTACNTHPCDGKPTAKVVRDDVENHRRELENARFIEKREAAQLETVAALGKATNAVLNGKVQDSATDRPEFKSLIQKTEEMLEMRERHAKAQHHHHNAAQRHPDTDVPVPPPGPPAKSFVNSRLYHDKFKEGQLQLAEAKEVTKKVLKDVDRRKPTSASGQNAAERYRTEMQKANLAYKQKKWDAAKLHYHAAKQITDHTQNKDVNKPKELGEGQDGPSDADFAMAKKLLNEKLESINERRTKTSKRSAGVKSIKSQIDEAVAQAYKQASTQAEAHTSATITKIKETAKEQIDHMKAEMEAQRKKDVQLLNTQQQKIARLEATTESVAAASDAKVKEIIDRKAKAEERKHDANVENNLAAQQAIKHAKAHFDAAAKAAYSQGAKAARIRKAGGSATEQRIADQKWEVLKRRVETMRLRLELTKQLVRIDPEDDNSPSTASVERNEKQNVASKQAGAKVLESKCTEAKTTARVACAEAAKQESLSMAEKQSEKKDKEKSDKVKRKQDKQEAEGVKKADAKESSVKESMGKDQDNDSLVLIEKGEETDEANLDADMSKSDKTAALANDHKVKVKKSLNILKKCEDAKKQQMEWCGKSQQSERDVYNSKLQAAKKVAATAKYLAARTAEKSAQGQASKDDVLKADQEACDRQAEYQKLKDTPFKPTSEDNNTEGDAAPEGVTTDKQSEESIKKLVKREVHEQLAARGDGGDLPTVSGPVAQMNTRIRKEASKVNKLKKALGKTLLKKQESTAKLKDHLKHSEQEASKTKSQIKVAEERLQRLQQNNNNNATQIESATELVGDLKAKLAQYELSANEKTRSLKATIKAEKQQTNKLRIKEKTDEAAEKAQIKTKIAEKNAEAEMAAVSKQAAVAKHSAYKASMKAARTASEVASGEGKQDMVFTADTAADAAKKASELAVESTKFVFRCSMGNVKIRGLKAQLIKAEAQPNVKANLQQQLKKLESSTADACKQASKTARKGRKAKAKAKEDNKLATKEIEKEKKDLAKATSTFDPKNPLIKRDWKVVNQNGVLTAVLEGAPTKSLTNQSNTPNHLGEVDTLFEHKPTMVSNDIKDHNPKLST